MLGSLCIGGPSIHHLNSTPLLVNHVDKSWPGQRKIIFLQADSGVTEKGRGLEESQKKIFWPFTRIGLSEVGREKGTVLQGSAGKADTSSHDTSVGAAGPLEHLSSTLEIKSRRSRSLVRINSLNCSNSCCSSMLLRISSKSSPSDLIGI